MCSLIFNSKVGISWKCLSIKICFEKHVRLSLEEFYKKFNQFVVDNLVPPADFFPIKPLKELVDFYSINSG